MGESIIVQALHQPITTLLSILLIGIFIVIHQRHAGYSDVGMSFEKVIDHKEYWRSLSFQFAHVEILHLLFNLSALWSVGIAEQVMGCLYYLKQTALLLFLSPILCLLLYYIAIHHANKEQYRSVTSVGYSCVLFGWMSLLAVRQPGGITMLPLFGASLPLWLTPFGSLIFTSLIIPKASFIGHLAGLLSGYVIALPMIDLTPPVVVLPIFLVPVLSLGIHYAMNRSHSTSDIHAPLLLWKFPLPFGYGSTGDAGRMDGNVQHSSV